MTGYEILEERCVQAGNCMETAPTLFGFKDDDDDDLVATLKAAPEGTEEREALARAARGCPALAIAVHD